MAGLVLAGLAVGAALLWMLRREFIVLFASVLFGTALYVLAAWLSSRTPLGHRVSTIILYVAGFLVVVGFLLFSGQRVRSQYGSLSERIPAALREVERRLEDKPLVGSLANEVREWRINIVENGNGAGEQTEAEQEEANDQRSRLIRLTSATLSSFLIWAVLSFYIGFDGERYRRIVVRLVPPPHREVARELLSTLGGALPWWLLGRLASMGVVALLTGIGLMILGIPIAFTLALIAGAFSFVPFLGPIAALIPATLVTLDAVPEKLFWVFLVYGLVQLVESYVVTPRIQDQVVSVMPVVLITAQIVMGVLVGIPGVMFATPLALTVMVFVQVVYLKHGLGEEVTPPRAPA